MTRTLRGVLVPVALGVLALAGCEAGSDTGRPAPAATRPTSASPSPFSSDAITLTASTNVCAAFDTAAMGTLSVTTPSRTPEPGGSQQPLCVFPGAAAGDGPIGVMLVPDQTLDEWLQFRTDVVRLDVAGRAAASARVQGVSGGCDLGVELGGGIVSLSQSGTATDCRYLVPAAELAVAGLVAAG